MELRGLYGVFYSISEWGMRLIYVNFLWIGFTILGLVFLGITPSTLALFTVIKKWLNGDGNFSVFKTFCNHFKRDFLKVNFFGASLILTGVSLWSYFVISQSQAGMLFMVLKLLVITLISMYIIVLLYIFPVMTHYKSTKIQAIKTAFIFGVLHPFRSFIMVITFIIISFIFYLIPGLLPFFSVSLVAIIIMILVKKPFNTYRYLKN